LYRLYQHRKDLCNLPGYGEASIDAIIEGISVARDLYPHQIFGSVGIPYIGLKTMEKICRKVDILKYMDKLESIDSELCQISGIGPKTSKALAQGILAKREIIDDILMNVTIKRYEEKKPYIETVCFSMVRDTDFEEFLDANQIKVAGTLTKAVTTLIIPDGYTGESKKIDQAKERSLRILELTKAKEIYQYVQA
jgi:DNA ligase (NAD+)